MARRAPRPPKAPTAWCAFHDRMMNDPYIRKRRCTLRRCKYLYWLVDGRKVPHRPPEEKGE